MKLNISDTEWLFQGNTDVTVTEDDLIDRLGVSYDASPGRNEEDVIITLPDGTCRVLKYHGEDTRDGETTAWNFGEEDADGMSGDYYLKIDKD